MDFLLYWFVCDSVVSLFVCLMVLNATFNNISVISWRSVLLVEETGGPGDNYRPGMIYKTICKNLRIEQFEHHQKTVSVFRCYGSVSSSSLLVRPNHNRASPRDQHVDEIELSSRNLCFRISPINVLGYQKQIHSYAV
jgi:hypothetical protein